jgi:hypothetical protein
MSDRKNTIHKVPIKPHLKKFFLKSHSLTEPIKVDEDTLLGKQVLSILQDKRSLNGREMNIITEFDSDQLDDNLKLELSTTLTDRAPRIGKLIRINIYLQLVFKSGVILWIQAQTKAGINPYNACKAFLEYYDIDESEYSLDGVHQIWKRFNAKDLLSKRKTKTTVPKNPNRSTK